MTQVKSLEENILETQRCCFPEIVSVVPHAVAGFGNM